MDHALPFNSREVPDRTMLLPCMTANVQNRGAPQIACRSQDFRVTPAGRLAKSSYSVVPWSLASTYTEILSLEINSRASVTRGRHLGLLFPLWLSAARGLLPWSKRMCSAPFPEPLIESRVELASGFLLKRGCFHTGLSAREHRVLFNVNFPSGNLNSLDTWIGSHFNCALSPSWLGYSSGPEQDLLWILGSQGFCSSIWS